MYNPWQSFSTQARWILIQTDLPPRVRGLTDFRNRRVILDRKLLQVERRCVIAHELVHIERGPIPAHPAYRAREESRVEREVARRLIELTELGEALAWAHHVSEAADYLWVTEDVLRVRLACLEPSETQCLDVRLAFRHECEEIT